MGCSHDLRRLPFFAVTGGVREAVERVERAAANEKCARRRHRIHCTETGLVVGLLDNPAVKLLKQQILADKLIQERSL